MRKIWIVMCIVFFLSIPAFAKSRDVYPVSCNLLWTAIEDVLGNPGNYRILAINEAEQKTSFLVVGNLTAYTDTVALTERGDGCAMTLKISQVGPDDSDERGFRKRLAKSLARLQAGKAAQPTPAPGYE
ncbi:MAG TPA: hypothetical protein VLZ50_16135 [Terracidiphilus sp.]|nr:hypothetical protein [Terracidiphilus sp.]